jgi:hypothetical protein
VQGRIAICPFITPSVNRVVSRSLSPQSALYMSPQTPFLCFPERPPSVSPSDLSMSPQIASRGVSQGMPRYRSAQQSERMSPRAQAEGSRRGCLAIARHNRVKECHPERKPRGLLFSSKKGCLASLDMTVGDMTVGDITVGNMTTGDMTGWGVNVSLCWVGQSGGFSIVG